MAQIPCYCGCGFLTPSLGTSICYRAPPPQKKGLSMTDPLFAFRDLWPIKRNSKGWGRVLLEMLSLFSDPFSILSCKDLVYLLALAITSSMQMLSNLVLSWEMVPNPQRTLGISTCLTFLSFNILKISLNDPLSQTDTYCVLPISLKVSAILQSKQPLNLGQSFAFFFYLTNFHQFPK